MTYIHFESDADCKTGGAQPKPPPTRAQIESMNRYEIHNIGCLQGSYKLGYIIYNILIWNYVSEK